MSEDTRENTREDTEVPEFRSATSELTPQMRAATSYLVERMQFMKKAGISFKGARDTYEIFGYDRQITNQQYRDRYARGGIAARIVEALPKETWRGKIYLIEDEKPTIDTEFEKAWDKLSVRLNFPSKLLRADILAGLSTYSVLLIGGGGNLDEELPIAINGPDSLLYLTPFSGGGGPDSTGRIINTGSDATIEEFDSDTNSERFGLPKWYKLRRVDSDDPNLQKRVHWSRIIHIAEGVLDNEVYGQPTLESVWNLLDDLDKVLGGGAEAFFLRANQGIHFNVDKSMGGNTSLSEKEIASLQSQLDEYQHKMRRVIRTRGVEVETLGSDVADFSRPADTLVTQIAGTKGIPKRILTGSEMGQLASEQDRSNWRDQINGRQQGHAEPIILRPLADRLIKYKYLPTPANPDYTVLWPEIEVLGALEKATGAYSWAQTNQAAGRPVFLTSEIRDHWEGMDELTPEQIDSEMPEQPQEQQKQVDQLAAAMKAGGKLNLVIGR